MGCKPVQGTTRRMLPSYIANVSGFKPCSGLNWHILKLADLSRSSCRKTPSVPNVRSNLSLACGSALESCVAELIDKSPLGVGRIQLLVLFPSICLSRFNVLQSNPRHREPIFDRNLSRIAQLPTASDHLVDDVLLKSGFFGVSVHSFTK